MSAVDSIINYKRKDEEDFYAILGCDESSTTEQIIAEYKTRALQHHPDKNAGDKEAEARFQLLNEAKEILCDPQKRAAYDKWRGSGIALSFKQWSGMKEHVQQSMHWSTPKTKDRMLESGASSGPSSLGAGGGSAAHRRASEGGANLHWGGRGAAWGGDAPSEVGRWMGARTKERPGGSGPSSLTAASVPANYRRASEGGSQLYMSSRVGNPTLPQDKSKNNEI